MVGEGPKVDDEPHRVPWAPRGALGPLALVAFAAALYAPMLRNELTNWDDLRYVTLSPFATLGLWGIPRAFTGSLDEAYYPLTHAVYCVVHQFFADAPLPYHLVQGALFLVAVAVLPTALATLGVRREVALWAVLLWLAHPLRVESVAWVANLKDTLSLAFAAGAFALFPRSRVAAWVVFCLSLLSKATVFPLAALFAALEFRGGARGARGAVRSFAWLLPAAALAGVAAWLHVPTSAALHRTWPGGSPWAALPSALWLPWQYLGAMLVAPRPQAVYDFAPVGLLDVRFLVAVAAWGALAAWVWVKRSRPGWALGVAAFALPFLPVTGLVPLAFHVADRYTLLPSLPVAVGVVLGAAWVGRRLRGGGWIAAAAVGSAAVVLAVRSEARLGQWRSGVSLWEADRGRSAQLAARVNLAGAYGGEGRWAEAIFELSALQKADPTRLQTLSDLVFALAARERMGSERIDLYVRAIEESGGRTEALRAIAAAALRDGFPSIARAVADWGLSQRDDEQLRALRQAAQP